MGWRAAPTDIPTATIDSQAAAGITMMRLALHRPVVREALTGVIEMQHRQKTEAKRQREVEERREKIAAELKAQEDEKRAKYKEKIEKAKAKARAKAAAKAGKAEL